MGKAIVRVSHDGTVNWWPSAKMVTWCSIDLKDWPFDHHKCNFTLGLNSLPESIHLSLSKELLVRSVKRFVLNVFRVAKKISNLVL